MTPVLTGLVGAVGGKVVGGAVGGDAGGGFGALLGGLLGGAAGSGALEGLLDKFKDAGAGDAVDSWVASGENKLVDAATVEKALGSETIDKIAEQTGHTKEDVETGLAASIPKVVDPMTPERSPTPSPAPRRQKRSSRRPELALRLRFVEGHGVAHERHQRLFVDLLALVEVDRPPRVPFEARIEQARRIRQGCPLGECHLYDALVGLAGADDSVVRPHRNSSPFPLFDDVGIGLLDQGTEAAEQLTPPVVQLLDSRVDQLSRRLVCWHDADSIGAVIAQFPDPRRSLHLACRRCPAQ
jgi:uncharacterized protein YidB (DUF937 family)